MLLVRLEIEHPPFNAIFKRVHISGGVGVLWSCLVLDSRWSLGDLLDKLRQQGFEHNLALLVDDVGREFVGVLVAVAEFGLHFHRVILGNRYDALFF